MSCVIIFVKYITILNYEQTCHWLVADEIDEMQCIKKNNM